MNRLEKFVALGVIVVAVWGAYHEREMFLNARTSAKLNNPTGGTATLFTATPQGVLPDGSTNWLRHAACVAEPHTSCTIIVYAHRSIHLVETALEI